MRFVSLQSKDVINVYDGKKIGYIADIELDWCQKCIRAFIVEKMNFFHFFCFFKNRIVSNPISKLLYKHVRHFYKKSFQFLQ